MSAIFSPSKWFKFFRKLPAINTDVSLTLGRIDLVARERTNLQPNKSNELVDAFRGFVSYLLDGCIYFILIYGCMAKERVFHCTKSIWLP